MSVLVICYKISCISVCKVHTKILEIFVSKESCSDPEECKHDNSPDLHTLCMQCFTWTNGPVALPSDDNDPPKCRYDFTNDATAADAEETS